MNKNDLAEYLADYIAPAALYEDEIHTADDILKKAETARVIIGNITKQHPAALDYQNAAIQLGRFTITIIEKVEWSESDTQPERENQS